MAAQFDRKRPWYLVLALLGALAFGIGGGCDGLETIAIYRNNSVDPGGVLASIANDADRARLSILAERCMATMDAAKGRVFPLAVAAVLIGIALVFFTMRAMAGRAEARMLLVQLVAAQAILTGASYVILNDVRAIDAEFHTASREMQQKDGETRDALTRFDAAAEKWLPPFQLAIRTFGSVFIVISLTRRRSREFLRSSGADPASAP